VSVLGELLEFNRAVVDHEQREPDRLARRLAPHPPRGGLLAAPDQARVWNFEEADEKVTAVVKQGLRPRSEHLPQVAVVPRRIGRRPAGRADAVSVEVFECPLAGWCSGFGRDDLCLARASVSSSATVFGSRWIPVPIVRPSKGRSRSNSSPIAASSRQLPITQSMESLTSRTIDVESLRLAPRSGSVGAAQARRAATGRQPLRPGVAAAQQRCCTSACRNPAIVGSRDSVRTHVSRTVRGTGEHSAVRRPKSFTHNATSR